MAEFRPISEGKAALAIADHLDVRAQVLVTPQMTIAVSNIATISVVPVVPPPRYWAGYAAIALPFAAMYLVGSLTGPFSRWRGDEVNMLLVLAVIVELALLFLRFGPRDPDWRLLVGASDGSLSYFTSPKRETLERVRQLLTEKIEKDETSSVQINFINGDINMVGEGATVGAFVTGANSQVATGGGRVGTTEINQSPGAVAGSGHVVSGNVYSNINYTGFIPQVRQLRAEYSNNPDYAYIVQRLDHLEELMRSGTPNQESKGALRALLLDLAQIFNAIPNALDIFRQIARVAGFPL